MVKTIKDYCVVRHGVDSCSYFQGEGIANTEFKDRATGIGDTEEEAFEDALDLLSEHGWNVENIPSLIDPDHSTISDIFASGEDDERPDDVSWYVTIKVK